MRLDRLFRLLVALRVARIALPFLAMFPLPPLMALIVAVALTIWIALKLETGVFRHFDDRPARRDPLPPEYRLPDRRRRRRR